MKLTPKTIASITRTEMEGPQGEQIKRGEEPVVEIRATPPDKCFVAVMRKDGFSLGIATRGSWMYHETDYPTVPTWEEAAKWADSCNDSMGLTHEDTQGIIFSCFAAREQQLAREEGQ